jgi:Fe-S-cluster containining protein
MTPAKEISSLSDLCTSCGLCCNGVLFDYAPVQADETDRLLQLGFEMNRDDEAGPRFPQPCIKFRDGCCTIYETRPAVCRVYRCELYKAVEKGDVSLEQAGAQVSEAKGLVARIWPMLKDAAGGAAGKQWGSLFREWQGKPPSERAQRRDAELVLSLTVLNQLLDRYFRRDRDRQVRMKEPEG